MSDDLSKYEIWFAGKLLCYYCNDCKGLGRIPLTIQEFIDRTYGNTDFKYCQSCDGRGLKLTRDGFELQRFIQRFK